MIDLKGKQAPSLVRSMFEESVHFSRRNWMEGLNKEASKHFYREQHVAQWEAASPQERGLWLTGKLWNDPNIMPSDLCSDLDVPLGSTYARGARKQREKYWQEFQISRV